MIHFIYLIIVREKLKKKEHTQFASGLRHDWTFD